ncbi:uncharacterized protein LOC132718128 [Ruditapes philippinarum]|uniref:uncharacterized protein LOC132718128 n=1 Tax=Ruditapes philippinarum TaxID=129788 RepID=UPI00295A659C|nr:uncharacterized protein LOC132718128 [Ruditapes philippinarum]
MECWIIIYFNTCFIVYNLLVHSIDCQCVLPLTKGTWLSSSRGTWTIPENRTEIQNFKASLTPSVTIHDLACYSSSGNRYILGTSIQLFSTIFIHSYTCLEIRTTSNSPSTYELYFVTDIDVSTGEPFNSNVSAVCDGTVEETGVNTNIIVADGVDIETVKQSLPDVIRGEYIVTITDQNGQTSNQTTMSSCNDTSAFYFTETGNVTQIVSAVGFSDSGILYNLKSFSSVGVTFIYTYNIDTSVDSSTTYRFSCWAVSQVSSTVYATVYPEVCQDGQNSTSVPRGGQILILEASGIEFKIANLLIRSQFYLKALLT